MSIFLNLPTPGFVISQSELAENRKVGTMPSSVEAYASLPAYWDGKPTYQPNDASKLKYWAAASGEINFLFVSGSLDLTAPGAFSDYSFSCYSLTVASFYRERLKAGDTRFALIPKLIAVEIENQSKLLKMDFSVEAPDRLYSRRVTADEAAYPIATLLADPTGPLPGGYRWTFASNRGLCFDPATGQVQSVDYQEYDRAYPIKTTVSVGGTGGGRTAPRLKPGVTPDAFCLAAFGALLGPGASADKTTAILANVE